MSALILSTIARGVLGGATTPYHATASKPGSVSAMAGTSGSDAMRLPAATASSLSWPPFTSGSDTPRLSNMISTLPPTRSCRAGAEPRYGTCWNFTLAIIWNSSDVRCEVEPLPWLAEVILPGLALASAMNAASESAFTLGLTTSALGTRLMMATGTNSVGSKASFGYRLWLMTSGGGGADNSV